MFKRGKPYLWVEDGDLHNTNIIIDERGSLSVSNIVAGPLTGLLKSIRKLPGRVALAGDVIPLNDEKVEMVTESLRESILSEYQKASQASYAVSALLNSASINCRSRWEILHDILEQSENYVVYKFNIRSCTYVDGSGDAHDLELQNVDAPKTEPLSVRDALILSIDRKGFDFLGKVATGATSNGLSQQYLWKEFRFNLEEEAASALESFCLLLVELEEKTLVSVKSYSGLG